MEKFKDVIQVIEHTKSGKAVFAIIDPEEFGRLPLNAVCNLVDHGLVIIPDDASQKAFTAMRDKEIIK